MLVLVDIGDLGFADRFVRGGRVPAQIEPFSLVRLSLLYRLVAADGIVERAFVGVEEDTFRVVISSASVRVVQGCG